MSALDLDANKPVRCVSTENTVDSFSPYPHQIVAWDRMTQHFATHQAGMLVVPTGGGKTAIAARWLLKERVKHGWRVLWLAQMDSLLWQAASAFERAAALSELPQGLTRAVVSSSASSWSGVSAECQVALSSIMTAGQPNKWDFVSNFVHQANGRVFVVVDEAHHAAAPVYQRVLLALKQLKLPVLGLSATPTRMDEAERKRLWNVFEQPIYEIRKTELISRGILATPVPKNVPTKIQFDDALGTADLSHLQRFGDLAPAMLERVKANSARNQLIVDHYEKHAEEYGKTLVFAIDIPHAETLRSEFASRGVTVEAVDSSRPNTREILEAYKTKADPKVLVNVMMLTEGVDAPCTRTVFLTRPTKSEVLLQQMIGRALRGPDAGGNETAHLVTFVDTWKHFDVLDAEFVVERGDVAPAETEGRLPYPIVTIDRELIRELYTLVRSNVRGEFLTIHQCLPAAWLSWDVELENDIQRRHVLIFENQVEGFRAMEEELTADLVPEQPDEDFARTVVRRFFADTPDPLPKWFDLLQWMVARKAGTPITRYSFDEKRAFDPRAIAKKIWEDDLGERAKIERLRSVFDGNEVCKFVYRKDFDAFREDVQRALDELSGSKVPSTPVSLAREPRTLRRWPEGEPGFDLTAIWRSVCERSLHFPKGEPTISEIDFAKSVVRGWYGQYRGSDRRIIINPFLNSPDVPRFVMEFLVYHEGLHADMPSAHHDRNFRERERRFQPSPEAAREAAELGRAPFEGEGGWRALADQFLDTLQLVHENGKY
jgi:superfamily II DNA or RNA helicase